MALTGLGRPLGTILISSTRHVSGGGEEEEEEEEGASPGWEGEPGWAEVGVGGMRTIFWIFPSSVARKKTSSRSDLVTTWSTTR